MRRLLSACTLAISLFAPSASQAWDYSGHRALNQLALESLPPDFPAFVRSAEARERIGFLAGEPDRWRNNPDLSLRNASAPDHYIDMEDLPLLELTAETLMEFRSVFLGHVALMRQAHPERFPTIAADKNKDHTRENPGTLPWAIAEYYARLQSAFSYLKTFEENDGTPAEIANAQANIIYTMGMMGHFVGDGSQPLHTTSNHNGWEGDNPKHYTTSRSFHALIDGSFLSKTGPLDVPRLATELKPAKALSTAPDASGRAGIFSAVVAYLVAQHAQVEPLYQLEKDGKLSPQTPASRDGRIFLERQIVTGANMLGSLWLTAWRNAPVDTFLRASLQERKMRSEAK